MDNRETLNDIDRENIYKYAYIQGYKQCVTDLVTTAHKHYGKRKLFMGHIRNIIVKLKRYK